MIKNKTLMVQGTTSDAGKSVMVTAICRILARRGVKVAPFKAQNMALNSAVTADGGEIGRAQAVQAQACCIDPITDMNPVLLKPNSDIGAQIIIHGKAVTEMNAKDYHGYKATAMNAVIESHDRLSNLFDAIIAEGAGSPAEINLRENDIANMGFAEKVDCPVILIADIDRGGVFAHIVGTLELLSQSEKDRVIGVIINRFRGDITLLQSGLDWLENRIDKPVIGVLPYLQGFHLEAEDAINQSQEATTDDAIKIIVPALPRISNHTDFDALRLHPQVDFEFIAPNQPIPHADIIILPGSKSVRKDLDWLQKNGWDSAIQRHLRYGGKLVGICGGFQMLGAKIHDPMGIESDSGSSDALGLLDFHTTLAPEKQLHQVSGTFNLNPISSGNPTKNSCATKPAENCLVNGYEIHAGISEGIALDRSLVCLPNKNEGVISDDNQIIGTYLHGLFDSSAVVERILQWAGLNEVESIDYNARREADIDRLADSVEAHLDLEIMFTALNISYT